MRRCLGGLLFRAADDADGTAVPAAEHVDRLASLQRARDGGVRAAECHHGAGHSLHALARDGRAGHLREAYAADGVRSEEHTSELQSLLRLSYAVFCLTKKNV